MFRSGRESSISIDQLNILIGRNNSGKTRVLRDLYELFRKADDDYTASPPESANRFSTFSGIGGAAKRVGDDWIAIDRLEYGNTNDAYRSSHPVEVFFELEPIVDHRPYQEKPDVRQQIAQLSRQMMFDTAQRAGFQEESGAEVLSQDWFNRMEEWMLTLPLSGDPQLELFPREIGFRKNSGSLAPLKALLDLNRINGFTEHQSLRRAMSRPSILCIRDSSGRGSLLVRIARTDFGSFAASLGISTEALETAAGPAGSFNGVRDLDLPQFRNSFAPTLRLSSEVADESPYHDLVGAFYQWDDEILVQVIDFPDLHGCPFLMKGTFITDSTEPLTIDVEKMVLEFASVVGRQITEFYTPPMDWLYRRGEAAEASHPYSHRIEKQVTSHVFKIHPAIAVACLVITNYVNDNLPDFIKEDYRFDLAPLRPDVWSDSKRVRYGLYPRKKNLPMFGAEDTGLSAGQIASLFDSPLYLIELQSVGAGIRRWVLVVLAMLRDSPNRLRIGTDSLEEQFRESFAGGREEELEDFDDPEYGWALWGYFCEANDGPALLSLEGMTDEGILLIDEPEANLHPDGVDSIRRWLEGQAVTFGSVFVATHSLKIFDLDFPSTSRFILTVSESGNRAITQIDVDSSFLGDWSTEMGFTPGEMFLATKRWLVVEGEVDKIVLETFYPGLLRRQGVRIVPSRGARNMDHMMEIEFLRGIGGRISVLLDQDAPDALKSDLTLLKRKVVKGYLQAEVERVDNRVDQNLKSSGVYLGFEKHDEIDIMFFLDPDAVRTILAMESAETLAPKKMFEDWQSAWNEFSRRVSDGLSNLPKGKGWRLTVRDFKEFLDAEFGMRITPTFTREVTRLQVSSGKIPVELTRVVEKLTSPFYGASISPDSD